jgi:hypothetical protein
MKRKLTPRLIFVDNLVNPEHDPGKAWIKTEVLVEANTSNSANWGSFPNGIGNDQFRFREGVRSSRQRL